MNAQKIVYKSLLQVRAFPSTYIIIAFDNNRLPFADLALLRVEGDVGDVVGEPTVVLQKRRVGGHIDVAE